VRRCSTSRASADRRDAGRGALRDDVQSGELQRGELLDLIEVGLLAVGGGPTLDYADAAAFLAGFEAVIEKARRRRLQ
jgi:hypothetical protein